MKSSPSILSSVLRDRELVAEIKSHASASAGSTAEFAQQGGLDLGADDIGKVLAGQSHESAEKQSFAEAIVLLQGRPSLLVKDDKFAEPELEYWKTRLNPYREALGPVIAAVGRVELRGHSSYDWVGTAWVVSDRLVVTNRHVASIFARRQGQSFVFRQNEFGQKIEARLDFKEEYQSGAAREVPVTGILFIAPDQPGQPDMAVLELGGDAHLPARIPVAASSATRGSPIAVIGFPAHDTRNGDDAMRDIFKGIYNVKRFAPGTLLPSADAITLQHDCSTLGGNSGSAIVNVETGEVIGLHFGGKFMLQNFAVKAEVIRSVLGRLPPGTMISLPAESGEAPTIESLEGREGYRADFLGRGRRVRLPMLSESQEEDALPVEGRNDFVLAYTHFSVVMCQSRRLCYFAAVNIDGEQSVNLRRTGSWSLDPRIPDESQCGNELYAGNNLDKGHMVRRLDPVWGSQSVAKQANNDTFLYTNACPQHAELNQGIWNDLEDHILSNVDERNLKVSVFVGPVFGDDDPEYREVQIPQDYWKVVVMVKADGSLSATAYMLTQRQLMDDIEAPGFVFGRYRTYQVPVQKVEHATGLSFGNLSSFDPLQETEFASSARELNSAEDLLL